MLSFLSKLFGKSSPGVVSSKTAFEHSDHGMLMPTVEVVHLSLPAILSRLPEDLRPLLKSAPADNATVALPLPTIIKQLPTGSVKISLASMHRQAPPGVFAPLPSGDKRLVEVPLSEVFRHVSPTLLKRRADQKSFEAPAEDLSLFGNTPNPYELLPKEMPEPVAAQAHQHSDGDLHSTPSRLILAPQRPSAIAGAASRMVGDASGRDEGSNGRASLRPTAEFSAAMTKIVAPTTKGVPPKAPQAPNGTAAQPVVDGPKLAFPLEPLAAAWPEEIRQQLAQLNGSAQLILPASEVSSGLAKGKVAFTWAQIRSWLVPALAQESQTADHLLLMLPLKVVAPIFLAATKRPKSDSAAREVDETIPTLFNSSAPPPAQVAPAPVQEGPAPLQEASPLPMPQAEPIVEDAPLVLEESALAIAPAAEEPLEPGIVELPPEEIEAADLSGISLDATAPQQNDKEVAPELHGEAVRDTAEQIGHLLGQPDKGHWTPGEMVAALARVPGVAGAVVALQEGLLVAEALAPALKGEAFAAFLPQIFARLNQYASEMQLGEVDDLLFTTKGAHCQIYRLGFIYFAVLGAPGEALPWAQIRGVADELTRQTKKTESDY